MSAPESIGNSSDCEGGTEACTGVDVRLVEDPYAAEIHGERAMKRLCEARYSELNADV